jgi:type II secretory pathway component PulC
VKNKKWNKVLHVLSVLPLVLVALILGAGLFVGGGDLPAPAEEAGEAVPVPAGDDSLGEDGGPQAFTPGDYREVVEKNVFSVSRRRPASRYTPAGSGGDSPSGPVDYTLLGVIVTGGEQGIAVIRRGGQGGEVKTYKSGEYIDNLVLEEVFYDRVVLRQGETERILELKPRVDEKASLPTPVKTPPLPTQKGRPRDRKQQPSNVQER